MAQGEGGEGSWEAPRLGGREGVLVYWCRCLNFMPSDRLKGKLFRPNIQLSGNSLMDHLWLSSWMKVSWESAVLRARPWCLGGWSQALLDMAVRADLKEMSPVLNPMLHSVS